MFTLTNRITSICRLIETIQLSLNITEAMAISSAAHSMAMVRPPSIITTCSNLRQMKSGNKLNVCNILIKYCHHFLTSKSELTRSDYRLFNRMLAFLYNKYKYYAVLRLTVFCNSHCCRFARL